MQAKKFFIFFLIWLSFSLDLFGQFERDTLQYSAQNYLNPLLNNSINKQLNTYNFATQFKYFYRYSFFFLGLQENFNSTIIQTTDKSIKDEQLLNLYGEYKYSEALKLGIVFNNSIYSDDRRFAINKASVLNSTLFASIIPLKNLTITPFGGISGNTQIGETDNGYIYGAEANLEKFATDDFEVNSMLKFQNEDISPRKNMLRLIQLKVKSQIEKSFDNTISGFFTEQRKDFYFAADQTAAEEFGLTNNLQSRIETNYFLEDQIKFMPEDSPLRLDLKGSVLWRNIERNTRYISFINPASSSLDTRIDEFKLDLSTEALYKFEDFDIALRISFTEREEKHLPRKIEGLSSIISQTREELEAQKNNLSNLTTITISSTYNLTANDKILVSVFHRKLVYDTPSSLNYDDRDELMSIFRFYYERKFNPFFSAFLNAEANINNIVYIFAERSSNNNIKRIIKLASGGNISLGRFISNNTAEVSANYTVFNFEDLNPNYRSYSFRQFIFRDSTFINLSKRITLFLTGYIKLSEQGDFRWSSFTSKPQRFLTEKYAEPKFIYNIFGLSVGAGIRYFLLTTYNIKDGRRKEMATRYRSIGPILEINYNIEPRVSFKSVGWYEFIELESGEPRELANFNLKLYYRF